MQTVHASQQNYPQQPLHFQTPCLSTEGANFEERVDYDIWYIQNWSLGLDIRILLRTAFGGMKNSEKLV